MLCFEVRLVRFAKMRWQVTNLPTSACKVGEAEEQSTERLSEDFGEECKCFVNLSGKGEEWAVACPSHEAWVEGL